MAHAHDTVTKQVSLPARLFAAMVSVEEARSLRRRQDIETLDRENPFLVPSPDAPWARADERAGERTTRPGSDAETPAFAIAMASAARVAPARAGGDLVELVVAVWAVVVALVLCALAMN